MNSFCIEIIYKRSKYEQTSIENMWSSKNEITIFTFGIYWVGSLYDQFSYTRIFSDILSAFLILSFDFQELSNNRRSLLGLVKDDCSS